MVSYPTLAPATKKRPLRFAKPGFDDCLQARARQRAAAIGVVAKAAPLGNIVLEGRAGVGADDRERQ